MSRDSHQHAVAFTLAALIDLRAAINRAIDQQHSEAAQLAVEAVGLPADATSPAGRVIEHLGQVNTALLHATRSTDEALKALTEYSERI